MANQHPSEVSIELSSPYRNSRRKSDKEYGAGHGPSTVWQTIPYPNIYEPKIYFPIWENKIFIIPCAFAVLFNPLFIYLPVIYPHQLCYKWNVNLLWIYVAIQSTIDVFYAMDIVVYSRRIRGNKPNVNRHVKVHILEWLPIIYRIYLCLPISQALLLLHIWRRRQFLHLYRVLRRVFYPIQYTLRAYHTFGLIKQRPNVESGIGRWFQAILDLLPFVIASHLYGALWYGFAVDREIHCWREKYRLMSCDKSVPNYIYYCDENTTAEVHRTCNVAHIMALCDPTVENTVYNFGIYHDQSNITRSDYFPRKVLLSFWWGLRNLSSFGSNLMTSSDMLEISFSILTSITGLVLFLIYLNARVEEAQKRKDRIKLRHKMQLIYLDIDMVLTRKNVSRHDKKVLKKLIMKHLQQKLEQNKDIDMQNLHSLLPSASKRYIMSLCRLTRLKKVPMFKNMKERVLKAISKHLELVTYAKSCYIIREGEPLWNVLFITQGTALSYKTSKNASVGGTTGDNSIIKCLKEDDVFGDELLHWAFEFASMSDFPVSPKTVMSQTNVEAFAISANNLRRVVSKFRLHFVLNLPDLEHSPLERMAAISLRAAWLEGENHKRGWNRLRELLNNASESA
ncbi:cyclic nucleotide-gated ion channel 1-like [Argentina anserina]|uniref:cyclic nucleotide-gated ion channel 1-like n=1 Tax=Argentina anserina TaxID=57926 RepID=UPI00217648A8|nr:cyclic nucleotide-gated ion channel 1-like [Potentilla anserina]